MCSIFVFLDYDGSVVAQFVRAHHLDVALNGAAGDVLISALILTEGVGTGVDEVLQRPPAVVVAEAVVNSLVTDQGVF